MNIIKKNIKWFLANINLEYIKPYKNPRHTLLGIGNLPIKTIIDIGANKGQFAEYISNIFPKAQLFCFEPLPDAFTLLNKWNKEGKANVFNLDYSILT